MFEQRELLDLAIHLERNGCRTYRRAAAAMDEPGLASLLEWMAHEEEEHAEAFSRLKQQLASTPTDAFTDEMTKEMIRNTVGDRLFSLEEADFSGCRTTGELFRIFITFEEDTIAFYEVLASFTLDPAARNLLESLVAEEKRHVEQLQSFAGDETTLPTALLQPSS